MLSKKTQNEKGFTLIELMVVLVIVGIVTGLMVPNISGFVAQQEINEAAQNVAGALRSAKEIAITKNVRTLVWISDDGTPAGRIYTIYRQPMPGETLNSGNTTQITVSGVSITLFAIDTKPISIKGNIGMQTKATGGNPDGGGTSVQQSLRIEFLPKGTANQLDNGDTTIYLMPDKEFTLNKKLKMRAITVSAATGRARIYSWNSGLTTANKWE